MDTFTTRGDFEYAYVYDLDLKRRYFNNRWYWCARNSNRRNILESRPSFDE